MTFNQLLEEKKMGAVYILARYFYRIGESVISDAFYDRVDRFLRANYYEDFKEYLERSYDDDPIPMELLHLIGVNPIQIGKLSEERKSLYNYLNEDKSLSIRSVITYEAAYPFFERAKEFGLDLMVSLKMDGVNTKMLYVNDEFALSLSRGRAAGDSFDYTDNSAKVMPLVFKTGQKIVKVTGESFVDYSGLVLLREKYRKPDGYVTGKSAAISLLRVKHELEDYSHLHTYIFSAEVGETLEESFRLAEENGFNVVPHFLIKANEIPDTLGKFKVWAKREIFDKVWDIRGGIPSDGIVVEVNDLNWTGTQHNQYVDRQIALKFEQWSYPVYKSVITKILIEQQRVNKSVRVEIEPVITADGNRAGFVSVHNPSILVKNNLFVGQTIYFERVSNAVNTVIYGERLKELLGTDK